MTLLSTVVAPGFQRGTLHIYPVQTENLAAHLSAVTKNLCGHPLTTALLRQLCPSLPEAEKGFWDGRTQGLAVRPRGGVRGGEELSVTLKDLEACLVLWEPLDQVWIEK